MVPRTILASAAACLLASCATRPPPLQSDDAAALAPSAWTAPSLADPVATSWSGDFSDAALSALIAEALENNFGLEAAGIQAKAAQAAARIAGSAKYPNLNASLNSGKQQNRFINFDLPGLGSNAVTSESHSLALSSQWEVDLWSRVHSGHASSIAQYEAAEMDFQALRLSLAGQVAKAYFDAIEAARQHRIAAESAANLETLAASLDRSFERGLAEGFDVRLTRAQAAASRAAAQSRLIQKDASIRQLETLLGRYPSGRLATPEEMPALAGSVPAGLPSQLLERRPDLVAAERRLAASYAQNHAVQRNWLPRISLTGSAGTTSNELSNLLDRDHDVWSLAGNLAQPLFAAGQLKAERQQSQARFDASAAQFKGTALNAFREVETALRAETELALLDRETARAAEESALASAQARDKYQRGLIDISATLQAENRAFESQGQLLSIQNRRLQNRVALRVALGGSY